VLQKKRAKCAATKANGDPCTQYAITDDVVARMLDKGISLVSDPTSYCSWHCRTPEALRAMSRKGGRWSPKRAQVNPEVGSDREPMPDEMTITAKTLIRQLLAATLPTVFPVEPDIRTRALGVYLALQMYDPDDVGSFVLSLLPYRRPDEVEGIAQEELRATISQLAAEDQAATWKLLAR
jgi:hypothetical protein